MFPFVPGLTLSATLIANLIADLSATVNLSESLRLNLSATWAGDVVTAAEESAPLSALVWWLIPLAAFMGSIMYVIWVTKFQSRYQNETNRSVGRFQRFQESLEKDRGRPRDSHDGQTPYDNKSAPARNPSRYN